MDKHGISPEEVLDLYTDPDFVTIFLPLYRKYKQLDRGFDKKMIDKDIETLRKKFETISKAKQRRKPTS